MKAAVFYVQGLQTGFTVVNGQTFGWLTSVCAMRMLPINEHLGKPVVSEMDEFPENFRTAFDPHPPPAPFLEKNIAIFSANWLHQH